MAMTNFLIIKLKSREQLKNSYYISYLARIRQRNVKKKLRLIIGLEYNFVTYIISISISWENKKTKPCILFPMDATSMRAHLSDELCYVQICVYCACVNTVLLYNHSWQKNVCPRAWEYAVTFQYTATQSFSIRERLHIGHRSSDFHETLDYKLQGNEELYFLLPSS